MADLPPLPPGATLDQANGLPPLPPGATLDASPSAAPPKLPNTQPIQDMVQRNLASQPAPTDTSMPQTDAQKLDVGVGLPLSTGLKSGISELPADHREQLIDAYKNGTATNAGDFYQSVLPSAAASINPVNHYAQLAGRTAIQTATWVNPYTIGAHLFDIPLQAGALATQFALQHVPESSVFHIPAGAEYNAPPTFGALFDKIGETLFPKGAPQNKTEELLGGAATFAGAGAIAEAPNLAVRAWNAFTGAALSTGGQISQEKANDWAKKNFPDNPTIQAGVSQAAGLLAMVGIGGGLHAAGHEALKPIIGDVLGKDPASITPQETDQTIAAGFEKAAPTAQDFHDTAAVMDARGIQQQDFQTGKPTTINAYHGSPRDFENFEKNDINFGHHYFTSDVETARGYAQEPFIGEEGSAQPNVRNANIQMNNPKVIDAQGKTWAQFGADNNSTTTLQAHLAEGEGHDGLIIKNVRDAVADNDTSKPSDVYVSFDANKINNVSKSTLDNLHDIYVKTGIRPDQVFSDAQSNPAIAEDIRAGRIPSAYLEKAVGGNGAPPPPKELTSIAETPDEGGPKKLSSEGASTSINPLAKIFNPAGMSDSAKDMATALRQGRGPENRDVAVIQDGLQTYDKDIKQLSDEDRLALIDYMENRTDGAVNPIPKLQAAADAIRDIYTQYAEKIQEAFPDVGLRKDYFTHQYEDEGAASKFFSDWVAKQGSERNLKERTMPTLADAMEAGLKPKTTNPIETVMNYVGNMSRLLAADKTIKLAQEFGVADYFKRGQQPDGWVPLDSNMDDKDGKILFAPEDAARVYNNDASEKVSGPAGDILDNIQRFNNFTSKLVLGLSGYHFSATTMASMASDVANGNFLGAITPFAETIKGGKYVDAYLGRSDLAPELQKALDLAIKNNTINVKQQDYWKAGPAEDYWTVFKDGSWGEELQHAKDTIGEQPIIGPVKVIANEIGRAMDTVAKPLFDVYIPRIKIAANIDELHNWLSEHPEATPEQMDRAAQDIGNSVDNRFGEMMRDNLFWHQITRQTLQTALLSYSWVTGAARMLGGIKDIGSTVMSKGGTELTSNARYLFGMAATYAVVNGVRTYLGTGQAPDDWKDFVYPRTGGTTPQGQEERELLPGHTGQFTNYLHEGLGELGNEISPGLKLIYHLTANSDWRGLPITNENNSWFGQQRWGDYLSYVLHEETPIGIKNFLQGEKKGSDISTAEQLLGARPAPRFITDPEGYDKMMKRLNDKEYRKKQKSDKSLARQYESGDEP